jgi:hypothetical protein
LQAAVRWLELGNWQEANEELERRAIDVAGKTDIRTRALDDPNLESLWIDISEI